MNIIPTRVHMRLLPLSSLSSSSPYKNYYYHHHHHHTNMKNRFSKLLVLLSNKINKNKMREEKQQLSPKTPPPPPLTIRLLTAIGSALYDLPRRKDGKLNRCLLLDATTSANPTPRRHVTTFDVTLDPELYFRLFLPTTNNNNPPETQKHPATIVFFHGGGFAFLTPASVTYDRVCRRLARRLSAAIVSVNYRRSPEHKFPAPYEDGIKVLRYLEDGGEVPANNLDLSNTFLMGDSAGGNIVHHVAKRYCSRTWQRVRLAGLVLIQPYFGGEERTESELRLKKAPLVSLERTDWLWKAFLPKGTNRDHEGANFRVEGEWKVGEGWPAAMVVVGGWDPLQDWQRRYAEWLRVDKEKEVKLLEYDSAIHAFYLFPCIKESGMLIQEIKEFMDTTISKSMKVERANN